MAQYEHDEDWVESNRYVQEVANSIEECDICKKLVEGCVKAVEILDHPGAYGAIKMACLKCQKENDMVPVSEWPEREKYGIF